MTELPPLSELSILFNSGNKLVVVFIPSSSPSCSSFTTLSEEKCWLRSGLDITTPLTSCLKNAYILPGMALMCFCGNSSVVDGMMKLMCVGDVVCLSVQAWNCKSGSNRWVLLVLCKSQPSFFFRLVKWEKATRKTVVSDNLDLMHTIHPLCIQYIYNMHTYVESYISSIIYNGKWR